MRVVKFLAILAVSGIVTFGLTAGIASALAPDPNDYVTCFLTPCSADYHFVVDDEGYDAAVATAAGVGQLASIGPLLGALVLVLPKVAYRRRDSLFIFVPRYGTMFVFHFEPPLGRHPASGSGTVSTFDFRSIRATCGVASAPCRSPTSWTI